METQSFGDFIFAKRKSLNHKRIFVADKLDVSATYIRDVEKGNRPAPNSELLERLIAVLDIEKGSDEYIRCLNLAAETRNDVPLDIKEFLIRNKEHYYPLLRKDMSKTNL